GARQTPIRGGSAARRVRDCPVPVRDPDAIGGQASAAPLHCPIRSRAPAEHPARVRARPTGRFVCWVWPPHSSPRISEKFTRGTTNRYDETQPLPVRQNTAVTPTCLPPWLRQVRAHSCAA